MSELNDITKYQTTDIVADPVAPTQEVAARMRNEATIMARRARRVMLGLQPDDEAATDTQPKSDQG